MQNALRVAGWGTVGFSIAFFATFGVNTLMSLSGGELTSAADLGADHWAGVVFSLFWGSAGVALIVATFGLSSVVWPSGGLMSRIATGSGLIAAGGWLLSGVWSLAQRGPLLTGNITAAGADAASEQAVIELGFVGVHAGALLFGVATIPWLALVAWHGATSRAISRVSVVFLWTAATGTYGVFAVTGMPFGNLVIWLAFLIVGASLLRRARRIPNAKAPDATEAAATAA